MMTAEPRTKSRFIGPAFVTLIGFDGRRQYVLWGADQFGNDSLVLRDGRVAQFPSLADAKAEALRFGMAAEEPGRMDLEPAHDWLKGKTSRLSPEAGLNMWNLALDVSYTLKLNFNPVGSWADACYGHLMVLSLPHLFDDKTRMDAARWPTVELRRLYGILGKAVHVLRIGFSAK